MSNVILADTNVLSTFAKVGRIPLLLQLFKTDRLGVTPAVYEEFQAGVTKGYTILQP
jgi:predicted nucleic acid-binding protein